MPVIECKPLHQDQNGTLPNASTTTYTASAPGDGNIQITSASPIVFRFYTQIPAGSVLNSAYLRIGYGAKFGDQSASASAELHYARNSGSNATPLVQGVTTWNSLSPVLWNTYALNYVANSGAQATNWNVTSIVGSLLTSYGLVPGGHITFMVYPYNENGDLRLNTFPQLIIDYTPPAVPTEHWDFSMLSNPDFNSNTNGWDVNQNFFGNITAGGTLTRDTTFTRNGIATGKFTFPTPEAGKGTGFNTGAVFNEPNASYVFTGWAYIPSSVTVNVGCSFFYRGGQDITGPRDQWIPFCSNVVQNDNGYSQQFPAITTAPGYTAGQSIWVSDMAVFKSTFRQYPWTARSTNKATINHFLRDDTSRGPHVRRSVPKGRVTGSAAARRNYRMDPASGLWIENAITKFGSAPPP